MADDTTAYSSIQTSDFFDRLAMTGELEGGLRCVEWGERWLVSFNTTKTKLLSFNRHRESSLLPLRMYDIELPESASFRLPGLVFTPKLDWKPSVQSAAADLRDTLYMRPLGTSIKPPSGPIFGVMLPCLEWSSYIWSDAPQ